MKKTLSVCLILCTTVSLFNLFGCSKSSDLSSKMTTPADKISGPFSGSGKRMQQGLLLGAYTGCITPPGCEANLITGSGNATITKVTDSTINITLSGGPFTNNAFSRVPITENAGTITFAFGSYDENSKFLSISANTGTYLSTGACLTGLPYYSGWPSFTSVNVYTYQTIGHTDFTGTKQ